MISGPEMPSLFNFKTSKFPGSLLLIQKVPFIKSGWYVLFSNVADVLADERFHFELESVLQHEVDFLLPRLLVCEPWILRDLLCALGVLVVEFDLNAGTELAAIVVDAAQSEKASRWNRHAAGFIGEVDRSLLDHAVNVVPPRIVIQEAIHRQF